MSRAQANLTVVGVALLLLTATAGLSVSMADRAFVAGQRDPADRRMADSLADRIVEGPLALRPNVLDRGAVTSLTVSRFEEQFPAVRGHDVRVRLDNLTLVERGSPDATVRRVVLVATEQSVTSTPRLSANVTTVPRRTDRVTLSIRPPPNTTVRSVRANDRIVLHEPAGLDGRYQITVSRFDTLRLRFETTGPLPRGSVRLTYYPTQTTKAVLAVSVDV